MFGLAILSTSEEIPTHQLGRKPLGKLRGCYFCFAALFLIVEYPPQSSRCLIYLCHYFFKTSGSSLFFLSYLFIYFIIKSLQVGLEAFSLAVFLVTFTLPSITPRLQDKFQSFQNWLLHFAFLFVTWFSVHLLVVGLCGLCWLAEGKSQDTFMQLILFAYALVHVCSDMQALPEKEGLCCVWAAPSREQVKLRQASSLRSLQFAFHKPCISHIAHCVSS